MISDQNPVAIATSSPIGETDATDENKWFGHLYLISNVALLGLLLGVDGTSQRRKALATALTVPLKPGLRGIC